MFHPVLDSQHLNDLQPLFFDSVISVHSVKWKIPRFKFQNTGVSEAMSVKHSKNF